MHQFFAFSALLSVGYILLTQARLASLTPASHVTTDTLTYTCPDASEKTVPFKGENIDEDVVVYVKPSLLYPFNPTAISFHTPRLMYAMLMCAGMCMLWAYVVYLAALKVQN